MKRIKILTLSASCLALVSCLALASCMDSGTDSLEQSPNGELSLSCFTSTATSTSQTKATTEFLYSIDIVNDEGTVVSSFEDQNSLPEFITLPRGQYTAHALTKGSKAVSASLTPSYEGIKEFTITPGHRSSVVVNAALRDVKVTAVVSDEILAFYKDCRLVITNNDGGILDFTESGSRVGYFKNSGFISWTMTGLDLQGKPVLFSKTIENTLPREHYTLNFALETVYTDGLDITVQKEDLDYSYNITIGITGAPGSVMATGAQAFAKYATVSGFWKGDTKPQGLAVEYRAENSQDWLKVGAVDGVTQGGQTPLTAKITRLAPQTKYFFRVYSDQAQSAPVSFTTQDVVDIENLNFDTWSKKKPFSAEVHYPNGNAANSFWATGNEGTAILAAANKSTTTPVDGAAAVAGKAVRMESVNISGIVKTFAAGNIFTGYFKTNTSNPIESVKFGRPYTGRPKALKGWYKYKSTTINYNYAPSNQEYYQKFVGKEDSCHIYLKLENWGANNIAPENRPAKVTTIGYGEFKTASLATDWTEFKFDINYLNLELQPTHAVLAASSSVHGGFFVGGAGSELFIDEFQLIWE